MRLLEFTDDIVSVSDMDEEYFEYYSGDQSNPFGEHRYGIVSDLDFEDFRSGKLKILSSKPDIWRSETMVQVIPPPKWWIEKNEDIVGELIEAGYPVSILHPELELFL
jgi:hypothetical protein